MQAVKLLQMRPHPPNPTKTHNPITPMHPVKPHFTAIDDLEVNKRPKTHIFATSTPSYPRILLKQSGGHQGAKQNDQVHIWAASQSKGFSSDRRFWVGQRVEVFWKGCWKRGRISGVKEGFRYLVVVEGRDEGNVEICGSHLWVYGDGDDGSSSLQLDCPQKKSFIDGRSDRMQSETEQERHLVASPESGTTAAVGSSVNGNRVKLKIKYGKKDLATKFSAGSTVEVRSANQDGRQGSWYTATVVESAGTGMFLVEYKNLKSGHKNDSLREVANEENIRPCPPEIPQSHGYKVLQEVDSWYNNGWWEGVISEVLDGCKYIVYFASTNQDLVFPHSHLRPHQDWVHGKWVLASLNGSCLIKRGRSNGIQLNSERGGSFDTNTKPGTKVADRSNGDCKGLKVRIKYPLLHLEPKFSPGTTIEVKSDEDGYRGSWYTATVIGSAGVGKFLVEYKTLTTDDETNLLKEVVSEEDIRPYPPEIPQSHRYQVFQEVDAWYNDGWWEGAISEVLDEWKYGVYFASTNEKFVYHHYCLRPHQNWVHGKWDLPSLERPSDLKLKATPSKREYIRKKSAGNFLKGAFVEVRRDEQGYERSWYYAVIVRSKRNGRFLVEYNTLKADDKRKFLREEIDALNIRPFPPQVKVNNQYHLLEKVDAWYNGGWWEGLISEFTTDGKYIVFFEMTREEMEFHHVNLRKHHEWIDGKWIAAYKDN